MDYGLFLLYLLVSTFVCWISTYYWRSFDELPFTEERYLTVGDVFWQLLFNMSTLGCWGVIRLFFWLLILTVDFILSFKNLWGKRIL